MLHLECVAVWSGNIDTKKRGYKKNRSNGNVAVEKDGRG